MKLIKRLTLLALLLAGCTPSQTKPFVIEILAIPLVIAAVYLPFEFYNRYSTARNFVEKQEDIESYAITIETKRRHQREKAGQLFSGPDYRTVIRDAAMYAQTTHTRGIKMVAYPAVTLVEDKKSYQLHAVLRKKPPVDPTAYRTSLENDLTELFVIPSGYYKGMTYSTRLGWFGLYETFLVLTPVIGTIILI